MPLSNVSLHRNLLVRSATNAALHNPQICAGLILSTASMVRKPLETVQQSRNFFWWNFRGQDWSSYLDSNFQKHMKRRQRRLVYKYAKALRRSELWERDASHNTSRPSWGWRLSSSWGKGRWVDDDRLSSLKAKPQEPDHGEVKNTWSDEYEARREKAARAFEKFKEKIDADPYGAVFGRRVERLHGYSSLGRPWSSLSWCLKSWPPHEGTSISIESKVPDLTETSARVSSAAQSEIRDFGTAAKAQPQPHQDIVESQASQKAEEYEYDPISMRKVLKIQPSTLPDKPSITVAPEKAVDVPVKTFTQYRAQFNEAKPTKTEISQDIIQPGSQSSKIPAYQDEANACGPDGSPAKMDASSATNPLHPAKDAPSEPKTPAAAASSSVESTSHRKTAESESPDEALFAGTTYHSRIDLRTQVSAAVSNDWLAREGFAGKIQHGRLSDPNLPAIKRMDQGPAVNTTGKPEPATSSGAPASTLISDEKQPEPSLLKTFNAAAEKADDVDLLRASDVRASTRSARKTKTEQETEKKDKREELEADFTAHQQQGSEHSVEQTKGVGNTKLDVNLRPYFENMWNITRQYTTNKITWEEACELIKAKSGFKMDKTSGSAGQMHVFKRLMRMTVDKVADKLRNKNGRLAEFAARLDKMDIENPQVIKVKAEPVLEKAPTTSPPNREVAKRSEADEIGLMNEKTDSDLRTVELQRLSKVAEQEQEKSREQLQRLARELRSIYEEMYGVVDVKHRQIRSESQPTPRKSEDMAPNVEATAISDAVQKLEASLNSEIQRIEAITKHASTTLNGIKKARFYRQRNLNNEIIASIANSNKNSNTPNMTPSKPYSPPTTVKATPPPPPPTLPPAPAAQPVPAPALYKVFAYDSSTLQMTIADTSSSSTSPPGSDPPLPPTEVLSRLNSPAKFLPYFKGMQDQGFEIVSGGGDMLVFKKVRDAIAPAVAEAKEPVQEETIQAEEPKTTGNAAEPAREKARIVRREEERFSGSNRKWQDELQEHFEEADFEEKEGRFVKAVRRMLYTGLGFAAVCYAIGAVAESFRAMESEGHGGGDGREGRRPGSGRPGMFRTEDSR